jgi:hypothetical protein
VTSAGAWVAGFLIYGRRQVATAEWTIRQSRVIRADIDLVLSKWLDIGRVVTMCEAMRARAEASSDEEVIYNFTEIEHSFSVEMRWVDRRGMRHEWRNRSLDDLRSGGFGDRLVRRGAEWVGEDYYPSGRHVVLRVTSITEADGSERGITRIRQADHHLKTGAKWWEGLLPHNDDRMRHRTDVKRELKVWERELREATD